MRHKEQLEELIKVYLLPRDVAVMKCDWTSEVELSRYQNKYHGSGYYRDTAAFFYYYYFYELQCICISYRYLLIMYVVMCMINIILI